MSDNEGFQKVSNKKQKKKEISLDNDLDNNADNIPEQITDFEEMTFLSDELFEGIMEYGFKYPSPIQASSIHLINSGYDLIAQAQSGTGKTGAFTIGSLSRIEIKSKHPQVVVVANTKILASQIKMVMENVAKNMDIKFCLCVGGVLSSDENVRQAQRSHVLIGTPGRLADVLARGSKSRKIDKSKIKTLIMDETDVLLKEDFVDQIKQIIKNIGKKTQICIFSASFTRETYEIAEQFLMNPFKITIRREKLSLDKVNQYDIKVGSDEYKFDTLEDLLKRLKLQQSIIFVNSKRTADVLKAKLNDCGYRVGIASSKMNHVERETILCDFRLSSIRILISTDVASRGFDVDDLRCVINFDFPKDADTYLHRVGRSGRFGSQGIALNFTTDRDYYQVENLKSRYKIDMPDMPDPEDINQILDGMTLPSNKVLISKIYKNEKED